MNRRAGYPILCGPCSGNEELKPPPPEKPRTAASNDEGQLCVICREEIYFANEAWRHRSTRRAEAVNVVPCTGCGGAGNIKSVGTTRLCTVCHGNKTQSKFDHLAEPSEELNDNG